MEKIVQRHSGRFTLRSHGQKMGDGRFQSTFVVTEHTDGADVEIKSFTGAMFSTELEAVDAGIEAAIKWLDEFRPVGG